MKLLKIKVLVIAAIMLAASSAFASLSYNVSVDTSTLFGNDGYLYFQFAPGNSAQDASASISNFNVAGGVTVGNSTAGSRYAYTSSYSCNRLDSHIRTSQQQYVAVGCLASYEQAYRAELHHGERRVVGSCYIDRVRSLGKAERHRGRFRLAG